MEIEGKGFVIKDKRAFDEKGELKEEKFLESILTDLRWRYVKAAE